MEALPEVEAIEAEMDSFGDTWKARLADEFSNRRSFRKRLMRRSTALCAQTRYSRSICSVGTSDRSRSLQEKPSLPNTRDPGQVR